MSEKMARVMMVLSMVEEKLWQIMRKSKKSPTLRKSVNQKL